MSKKLLEALELVKRTCELYIKSASHLIGSDIIGNQINEALNIIQTRLESIDNDNPSEALECLKELTWQLYGDTLDIDRSRFALPIKNALLKAQEDEKLKVDICEMFGLDNLFPYNDTKAILKELEEYMGRKNQLWVDFMKTSKESKEQKKVLEILKEKNVDIIEIKRCDTLDEYISHNIFNVYSLLTQEEFDTLKRYFG